MPRAFSDGFSAGFGSPHNFGTFALKIHTDAPDPGYQDGDIVMAFNRRQTRHRHADILCHPRRAPRTPEGLIPTDEISRHYFEVTHQYRFQRVSEYEVVRENLWTGEIDVIDNNPNDRGERMNVPLFIKRHRNTAGFGMFGFDGAEIWYGGNKRFDNATLDTVWARIEEHSPHREVNYGDWPTQAEETKSFLFIRVNDFTDEEERTMLAPMFDETDPKNPVLVRRRNFYVPFRTVLRGMSAGRIAQVDNRAAMKDFRAELKHVRSQIVRMK
jgi:hypothetical protein